MLCRKCQKESPDGATFCAWCGTSQHPIKAKRSRPNGTGCAYKRGKTWEARITVGWKLADGKKVQVVKTKGGFATKREALEYCVSLKSEKKLDRATFEQVYTDFLSLHEKRVSKQTIDCYKAAYKHFKALHYRSFIEITASELQSCLDGCKKGKRTIENMKALAGLLYKHAGQNDITDKNYAQYLFTGNGKKGTRPAFTTDEVEKIKNAIWIVPYADYVYFMIYTGYRPSEMLRLKKDSYDSVNGCLIGGIKTTAGKDRPITISPKIAFILARQLEADWEYLFPRADGKPMSEAYFREYCFNPCMQKLSIANRTPYSARHTFANLMKDVRAADTDKAALMGHANASMTKAYQSADVASLKRITDAL